MTTKILTQAQLKESLHYNPRTGIFTWLFSPVNSVAIGSVAGNRNQTGYNHIQVNHVSYLSHRLVFLYMTGKFPPEECDHLNHIRDDNRWENLRLVSRKENSRNNVLYKTNKSGQCGVFWNKPKGKWYSNIHVDTKTVHLGAFSRFGDAVKARKKAELHYGFHANNGY